MKLFSVFFLALSMASCMSQKIDSQNKNITFQTDKCLDDGKCTINILYNSKLEVKNDNFGNLYPEIKDGNKIVVKHQYRRDEIENIADSNYSEIILFEVDNDKIDLHLLNKNLQNVKMLYGRLCFCRGSTGYYKVEKGDLKVNFHKDKLEIDLYFEVDKIPQKINRITEIVPLK
ncbi:MAG: hypothetical protein ABFR05_00995 [Bacteroidota bacterium]